MRVGVPKEIKSGENRIALTPEGVRGLVARGHKVLIQQSAGAGVGLSDEAFVQAGAQIAPSLEAVYEQAELIVKVKEPQPLECALLHAGQLLFTYLHLAALRHTTEQLLASGCTAIAYETVTDGQGGLPLLAPMSEVAGRLSVQAAARALEAQQGGAGVLLSGVPGVAPAEVLILGGGVVGSNAARVAVGMGARVTLVDKSPTRLRQLDDLYGNRLRLLAAAPGLIESLLPQMDVVIGAVLVPGAAAPKLITEDMLSLLRPGRVLVDVAIDQGGCFATSRATTHADPTYVYKGIVHYAVSNMPGAVARTATWALTNATLPYVLAIADQGLQALQAPELQPGVQIHAGSLCCQAVANALQLPYCPVAQALALH